MRLVYIYHSCFAIEAEGYSILIDYFRDTSSQSGVGFVHDELLNRPGRLYVLSSHFHPDHFNPEVLAWKEQKEDIQYLFSKDILKRGRAKREDAYYLKKGDVYKDENLTLKAYGSTDVGISFLINMGDQRVFHAGDLNNWHWKDESTEEEAAKSEKHYLDELEVIAQDTQAVDLAMFPVDPRLGTDFMLGAQQFIERIQTGVLVPMHFWESPDEVLAFAPYAEARECRYVVLSTPGEQMDIDRIE